VAHKEDMTMDTKRVHVSESSNSVKELPPKITGSELEMVPIGPTSGG